MMTTIKSKTIIPPIKNGIHEKFSSFLNIDNWFLLLLIELKNFGVENEIS